MAAFVVFPSSGKNTTDDGGEGGAFTIEEVVGDEGVPMICAER